MGCIDCGFTNGHDEDCPSRPRETIGEGGELLSSRPDAPAPAAPSMTPDVAEALRTWVAAKLVYEQILDFAHETNAGLAKARDARNAAEANLRAAVDLRDKGVSSLV